MRKKITIAPKKKPKIYGSQKPPLGAPTPAPAPVRRYCTRVYKSDIEINRIQKKKGKKTIIRVIFSFLFLYTTSILGKYFLFI